MTDKLIILHDMHAMKLLRKFLDKHMQFVYRYFFLNNSINVIYAHIEKKNNIVKYVNRLIMFD